MVLVRGEVSHQQSLEILRGSDLLLLVGFAGPGAEFQVPGKLFEYLGVGRPVLALAPQDSAIADIMARSGARGEVCDPDNPVQILAAIRHIASSEREGGNGSQPTGGLDSLTQFTRREQVGRIAELLRSAAVG
jgi:hypothetical protein